MDADGNGLIEPLAKNDLQTFRRKESEISWLGCLRWIWLRPFLRCFLVFCCLRKTGEIGLVKSMFFFFFCSTCLGSMLGFAWLLGMCIFKKHLGPLTKQPSTGFFIGYLFWTLDANPC